MTCHICGEQSEGCACDSCVFMVRHFPKLLSLVDSASVIVELFDAKEPAQKSWKKRWLGSANFYMEEWNHAE